MKLDRIISRVLLSILTVQGVLSAQNAPSTVNAPLSTINPDNVIHSDLYDKWSAGVGIGNASIIGDFSSFLGKRTTFDLEISIFGNYHFSAAMGVAVMYHFGLLSGYPDVYANQKPELNNKYFKGSYSDFNVLLNFNINSLVMTGNPIGDWLFTLYAGLGYMVYSNDLYTFDDVKIKGASNSALHGVSFPLGFGVKRKVNRLMDIELRTMYTTIPGDRLDAVQVNYRDLPDGYFSMSLNASFKFGQKSSSIQWASPEEDAYQQLLRLEDKVKRLSRLAIDTDDDGVSDFFDKNSETPEGEKVAGDGTALDIDRDGIPDYEDSDPLSNIGRGVLVNEKGTEVDTDGDGVPDSQDLEVTRNRQVVNFQGISVGNITIPGGGIDRLDAFLPVIYFDSNSSKIKQQDYGALSAVSKMMKLNPDYRLRMLSFADNKGSRAYNKKLSQKRAESVIEFFIKMCGLDVTRFEVVPYGKDRSPIYYNESYRSLSRRVEFKILRDLD